MHGDILGQLGIATLQGDQHADAVTVQISTNHFTFHRGQTTDVDVLAALGDQRLASGFTRSDQRGHIGQLLLEGLVQAFLDECLEVVLKSQEVSLRVNFDDQATATFDANGDRAFSSDVARLLGGLDGARGTHVVNRLFDVTASGDQSLLALHHALTGTLAQFFDQGCSDFCHVGNPLDLVSKPLTQYTGDQFARDKKGA